jgi:hypothetical protein
VILVADNSKYNNKKFELNIVSRDSIELSNEAQKRYFDLLSKQRSLIGEFKKRIANSSNKDELVMARHIYMVGILYEYSACIENIITLVDKNLSGGEKEEKAKSSIKSNYSNYINDISNINRIWNQGLVSMITKSDSYIRNPIKQIDGVYNTKVASTKLGNKMLSMMILGFIEETNAMKELNEKLKIFIDRMNVNRIFRV